MSKAKALIECLNCSVDDIKSIELLATSESTAEFKYKKSFYIVTTDEEFPCVFGDEYMGKFGEFHIFNIGE